MENTLYQRDWYFNRKWFTLAEHELKVKQKSLFRSAEYAVNYEDVGSKILISKSGKKAWIIVAAFMFFLSIIVFNFRLADEKVGDGAEIFYLTLGAICCLIYFLTYKHSFYLTQANNANAIEFLANKPTKERLNLFIEALKAKQKEVLLEKYGQLNLNLSYETQYHNLAWLRNINILTKEEYQEKLQQLDGLYLSSNRIGYGLSEN